MSSLDQINSVLFTLENANGLETIILSLQIFGWLFQVRTSFSISLNLCSENGVYIVKYPFKTGAPAIDSTLRTSSSTKISWMTIYNGVI